MREPSKVILGSGYHMCNDDDFAPGNMAMRQSTYIVWTYICDMCM